ncbi:protein NDUFAF4 homolog [Physella acuta]|uniref:protein NDUFAF4 homolog n=1 Tax=Physella acuta TaxID=109671 RepID=UPI0027DE5616|nr:protein NDUFAF4 homolog [Physella acuta]
MNENLKQIYVQSKMALPQISADKPLPQQRGMAEETELGAMETKYVVRKGRVNLKNVLSFLNSHQLNPKEVTAEKIAQEMKLDQTQVENVLKYFRIFHLHIPKEMFEKNRKFGKLYKQQIAAAEKNPLSFRLPGDMLRDSLKLGQNDSKLKEVKSENLDLPKT